MLLYLKVGGSIWVISSRYLRICRLGCLFLVSLALFFIWLFYKGYKAYQKNGWDDDFFKNDGAGFGGLG